MKTRELLPLCVGLAVAFVAVTQQCQARRFGWTARFGDGIADAGQKMIADSSGNIYVAGTVIVDESRESIGLVKYDRNGKELLGDDPTF